MDDLNRVRNFTMTDCGHCFHTSCLMTNAAHNGFGCPYCREQMAEVPKEEEPEEDPDDISYITHEEGDFENETSFTSMRMLFQRVEGDEVEEDQEQDQEQQQEQEQERQPEQEQPIPSVELIARKLISQGVTYEDLVKNILLEHDEFSYDENFETSADKIFGVVRIYVSNFQEATPEPEPRFRNLFTTSPMPDFALFTPEERRTISRDYSIPNRIRTMQRVWRAHNIHL